MKTYTVYYDLEPMTIEVEAESPEEAKEKVENMGTETVLKEYYRGASVYQVDDDQGNTLFES